MAVTKVTRQNLSQDILDALDTASGGASGIPTMAQVLVAGNNAGSVPLNMNFQRVINLAPPVVTFDATNKGYVDTLVAATSANAYTLATILSNGNSAGSSQIDMNSNRIVNLLNPTLSQDAATKNYVDTLVVASSAGQNLAQVLATGNSAGSNQLDMNFNKIIDLAVPTAALDAANKNYVDTLVAASSANSLQYPRIDNGVWVDPTVPEITGVVYNSAANAVSYIKNNLSPSTSNLCKFIHLGATDNSSFSLPQGVNGFSLNRTRLVGTVTTEGTASFNDISSYYNLASLTGFEVHNINLVTTSSLAGNLYLDNCNIPDTGSNLGLHSNPSYLGIIITKNCTQERTDIQNSLVHVFFAPCLAGTNNVFMTTSTGLILNGSTINPFQVAVNSGNHYFYDTAFTNTVTLLGSGGVTTTVNSSSLAGISKAGYSGSYVNKGAYFDNTVTNALSATEVQGAIDEITNSVANLVATGPTWHKYVIPYTALIADSPVSNQFYPFFSLGANQMLHACVIKPSQTFTGGPLTDVTVTVGVSAIPNKYGDITDIYTSTNNSTVTVSPGIENHTASSPIYANFIYTNGNNQSLVQGSLDIFIETSQLPPIT